MLSSRNFPGGYGGGLQAYHDATEYSTYTTPSQQPVYLQPLHPHPFSVPPTYPIGGHAIPRVSDPSNLSWEWDMSTTTPDPRRLTPQSRPNRAALPIWPPNSPLRLNGPEPPYQPVPSHGRYSVWSIRT